MFDFTIPGNPGDDSHIAPPGTSGSAVFPEARGDADVAHQPRSTADDAEDGSPRPKKRGRRPANCAECRRSKLKCDRNVPCSNCRKSGCPELCPLQARDQVYRPVVAPLRRENKAQDRQSPETGPQPIRSSPLPTFWAGASALDGPRPEDTGHRTEMGGSSILPLVSQQTAPPSHSQHGFDALHNLLSEPDPTAVSSSVPPNPFPASTFDDFPSSLFDFSILSSRRNSFNSFLPVFPEIPPVTNGEGSAVEGTADQLSSTMSAADQAFWEAALFEGFEQISPVEAYPQAPDTGNTGSSDPPRQPGSILAAVQDALRENTDSTTVREESFAYQLLARLPSHDEARVLMDSFLRFSAWDESCISRRSLECVFALAFPESNEEFQPQIVFSGPVDAIIMAHFFHVNTDRGAAVHLAWSLLWNMVMTISQAMGLHRDPAGQNLTAEEIEERRLVFWECQTTDVFAAQCALRPVAMQSRYVNTKYPSASTFPPSERDSSGDYMRSKYELARIIEELVDTALSAEPPSYSRIEELYAKLCLFEMTLPPHLQCPTTTSIAPASTDGFGRPIGRRNLKGNLQQFAMAFNLSEKIILLQQPYFIKAFRERPDDPSQSRFGSSFTAVMERSHMIIQIVSSILASHPVVASKVPLYWSRTFAAVVCLKILIFRVPTSPLCPAAMQSITTALSAFQACTSHHPSKEILRRLSGLTKIHQQCLNRLNAAPVLESSSLGAEGKGEGDGAEDEVTPWQTALVVQPASR
ncbi:hypothetical protein JCM24511_06293 [Saitozyma sp. JCM 24511]|nr:hypothetical protein JCM24511_06293 [Saitozyma sp. JCM 24511]